MVLDQTSSLAGTLFCLFLLPYSIQLQHFEDSDPLYFFLGGGGLFGEGRGGGCLKTTRAKQKQKTCPSEEKRRKRECLMIFLERRKKGHCVSDKRWNCFKGSTGETFETGCSTCGLSYT